MSQRVKFTVGAKEYSLGPLVFWSLENAWTAIQDLGKTQDTLKASKDGLRVFASGIALDETQLTEDLIKLPEEDRIDALVKLWWKQVTRPEIDTIMVQFPQLLAISGFGSGEAEATGSPSMETGAFSSPN